jgi:hypothetical protein
LVALQSNHESCSLTAAPDLGPHRPRTSRTSDLTDLGPHGPRTSRTSNLMDLGPWTLDIWPHGPRTLDLGHLTSRASDTSRPRTSRTPSYEQQWQPQQILSSHSSQPIHAKQHWGLPRCRHPLLPWFQYPTLTQYPTQQNCQVNCTISSTQLNNQNPTQLSVR